MDLPTQVLLVDVDNDGDQDLLSLSMGNDNYLYINNGDGTFTDRLQEQMGHTSYASMGNNVADINNDGLPDIFSLDMLPEKLAQIRKKEQQAAADSASGRGLGGNLTGGRSRGASFIDVSTLTD